MSQDFIFTIRVISVSLKTNSCLVKFKKKKKKKKKKKTNTFFHLIYNEFTYNIIISSV